MDRPTKKIFRCAIYTRKSTDHNLDLEFNSLDAQREACEAYIKSQAHEGWRLIPAHYDDGAFSGASLERPALQELLARVKVGEIDIIVVYKVDRLTRSLADFAKLVELFDQHSVSFVSVTQSFNTTSSMGRLTLNVLLSFAQFEREVIGERVRDKIAASKAKGIWVGGSIPLGYASVNKKLVVIPKEADTVRLIFQRYLELGSIGRLVEDLDRQGIRTRQRTLGSGKISGNIRFGVGALTHLLRNRFYVGEIFYRGKTYQGEQAAILERPLFEAVQAKLSSHASARQLKLKGSESILAGRIYDDRGNRMTPSHTNKRGARYRYYVSHAILQKRDKEAGSVARASAPELENLIIKIVHDHWLPNAADQSTLPSDQEMVRQAVKKVVVHASTLDIHLFRSVTDHTDDHDHNDASETAADQSVISISWNRSPTVATKGVAQSPLAPTTEMSVDNRDTLLAAIAKARLWIDDLAQGRVQSFAEIAKREGRVERHIRLLAPLAFVPPATISEIVDRAAPAMGVIELAKSVPYHWGPGQR
jgi:site-specific DNA recombinase